ncbi:UPF0187-domain-containing protein [Auriculariales sp. MPI-PUGE-AT-0066]|nr:UPF0187-domain-containing protein [Auriculariales sp. MPI-PUGE-AT-0066]
MGRIGYIVNRFQATVINDIWFEVMLFSGVAAMVACVSKYTETNLGISNQLLTVLGTVLGLVVSFRTSSAYERYQDGRKLWTAIQLQSRNLATLIWIHVPTERASQGSDASSPEKRRLEAIIEKRSMINLVQAFSVSVKHALRGEAGIYYEDLYPLLSFLPRFSHHKTQLAEDPEPLPVWHMPGGQKPMQRTQLEKRAQSLPTDSTTPTLTASAISKINITALSAGAAGAVDLEKGPHVHTASCHQPDYPLRPARNPPATSAYDVVPFLIMFKPFIQPLVRCIKRSDKTEEKTNLLGRRRKVAVAEGNVPLEITLFLHSYYSHILKQAGWLVPATASGFLLSINALQDSVANLERVRNTPIPFAYQAHLRMCMWLYLFLLPFQIYSAYKWLTIPFTAFAAFLLLGFLEIGREIEDPFGYDLNDLDLDEICLAIGREMHEITAHPAPEPSAYVFGPDNMPFAPTDQRGADEILRDVGHIYHGAEVGMGSIHHTMLQNWRQVNTVTRKMKL